MKAVSLNFYGIRVSVAGEASLMARVESDFGYFKATASETISFDIRVSQKDARPPDWMTLFRTRWSIFYLSRGRERRVCFFEKAWVAYRFELGECDIYCDDPDTSFEVVYLVILSAVGEQLDRRGVHRVHGMGLCREGRGILFLGASGVGKSTLALEFLKEQDSRLLSDDTPLVDEFGGMTAFPQRIALKELPAIDERFVHRFSRARYAAKYVVACEYFRDRIQSSIPADAVVYLTRDLKDEISIEAITRSKLFCLLLRWLVVGHEIPQIWQLYLRLSPLSLWWKGRILISRVRCAWAIAKRSRPWKVTLGDSARDSAFQLQKWLNDGTLQTRIPGGIQ